MPVPQRFAHIYLPRFQTDFLSRKMPELLTLPVVTYFKERNKQFVSCVNEIAEQMGAKFGEPLADQIATIKDLKTFEVEPDKDEKRLERMADWCVRYTPYAKMSPPNGIWLDITGGAHLFGGEEKLADDIKQTLNQLGYSANVAIADFPGTAWAVARFTNQNTIVPIGQSKLALAHLPVAALRVSFKIETNLKKLGFPTIGDLYKFPRPNLTKRFGKELLYRFDQALGDLSEPISPKLYQAPYEERLQSIEPISGREGIEIAARRLIDQLCQRLSNEQKGAKLFWFSCICVDRHVETKHFRTSRPSRSPKHIFKLLFEHVNNIRPGFGIEQFVLTAAEVNLLAETQINFQIQKDIKVNEAAIGELIDRLRMRIKPEGVFCVGAQESHWPQKCIQEVDPMDDFLSEWPTDKERPIVFLKRPEPIEVVSLLPDYPPKSFRWNGKTYRVKLDSSVERLEPEWWHYEKEMRDYFRLEDTNGERFLVFRSGNYDAEIQTKWFIHGLGE